MGGGSMLRLFLIQTVYFLLRNAPGHCRCKMKKSRVRYRVGQTRQMCEIRGSNTPLLYCALRVQPSCMNSWCTMPWLSKTINSIILTFHFWKHVALWSWRMFANPFGAMTLCFRIVRETPTFVTCNNLVHKVLVTVNHV